MMRKFIIEIYSFIVSKLNKWQKKCFPNFIIFNAAESDATIFSLKITLFLKIENK